MDIGWNGLKIVGIVFDLAKSRLSLIFGMLCFSATRASDQSAEAEKRKRFPKNLLWLKFQQTLKNGRVFRTFPSHRIGGGEVPNKNVLDLSLF